MTVEESYRRRARLKRRSRGSHTPYEPYLAAIYQTIRKQDDKNGIQVIDKH